MVIQRDNLHHVCQYTPVGQLYMTKLSILEHEKTLLPIHVCSFCFHFSQVDPSCVTSGPLSFLTRPASSKQGSLGYLHQVVALFHAMSPYHSLQDKFNAHVALSRCGLVKKATTAGSSSYGITQRLFFTESHSP